MAIIRHEEQEFFLISELVNSTDILSSNDVVYVKENNRSYRWEAGNSFSSDNVFVINQLSEAANGRWVSLNTPEIVDFEAVMDAMPDQFDASTVDVFVNGVSNINRANKVVVQNLNELEQPCLFVGNVKGLNTVNVYLENKKNASIPSQTVKCRVISFYKETVVVTNFLMEADWATVGVTDQASFEQFITFPNGTSIVVSSFSLVGNVLEASFSTDEVTFYFGSGSITSISNVESLRSYTQFWIENTNITQVPPIVSQLTNLFVLQLNNNQLNVISSFDIPNLTGIDFSNNQLDNTSYTNSEAWANALTPFINTCTITFTGNLASITGTNLESILLTKNVVIVS